MRGPVNKTKGVWKGPYLLLEQTGSVLFEIQDMVDVTRKYKVHAQRLDFYADASLEVTHELLEVIAHNNEGFMVEKLLCLTLDAEHLMVEVKWEGLESVENTWEHLADVHGMVPVKVNALLRKMATGSVGAKKLVKMARDALKRRGGSGR